jgi:hypothetical protein
MKSARFTSCLFVPVYAVVALWSGTSQAQASSSDGVTLYADANFEGTSETFRENVSFLGDTKIGNDSVSSVRVTPGCTVRFFDDIDFRGNSAKIEGDVAFLGDTSIGNDRASSIEVDCGDEGPKAGPGETDGVTLYHDANFEGGSVTLYDDVSYLGDIEINNDSVSSMRVGKGCEARLFQDAEFQGDSFVFTKDVPYLGDTPIGNDNASSIEVDCR